MAHGCHRLKLIFSFSCQDAMSVARNILKNPKLLPGGGATELTVSATLKQKSSSIEGIEKVETGSSTFMLLLINHTTLQLVSLLLL